MVARDKHAAGVSEIDDEDIAVLDSTDVDDADEAQDPAADEANAERIQFVRTGLTRVTFGGKLYRLRRPFFGEFKRLRVALEDANDEIAEAAQASIAVTRSIASERAALGSNVDGDVLAAHETEWRKRQREASRLLNDRADTLRGEWWSLVFDTISLDGKPKKGEWPAWVLDPSVAIEFVTHWRTAPQGRG